MLSCSYQTKTKMKTFSSLWTPIAPIIKKQNGLFCRRLALLMDINSYQVLTSVSETWQYVSMSEVLFNSMTLLN